MTTGVLARRARSSAARGRWWRFGALVVITGVALGPVVVVLVEAARPRDTDAGRTHPFEELVLALRSTPAVDWLGNSLAVSLVTTLVAILVSAPGGYVLSRSTSRAAAGYSVVLFVVQSIPAVVTVIPSFFLLASLHAVDTLSGMTVVLVSSTIAVATWMMSAYFDTVPVVLEEAAWVDGAGRVGSFIRIVLRNSLPGLLSVAMFCFLLAWNDFLVGSILLRSTGNYTAAVGLHSMSGQGGVMALATWMMVPPLLLFAVLHRHFSVGGIGGALDGR